MKLSFFNKNTVIDKRHKKVKVAHEELSLCSFANDLLAAAVEIFKRL